MHQKKNALRASTKNKKRKQGSLLQGTHSNVCFNILWFSRVLCKTLSLLKNAFVCYEYQINWIKRSCQYENNRTMYYTFVYTCTFVFILFDIHSTQMHFLEVKAFCIYKTLENHHILKHTLGYFPCKNLPCFRFFVFRGGAKCIF